eukprot:Skav230691  [mRNA]  locus=scaffold2202:279688:282453:- [translate_table: standard]
MAVSNLRGTPPRCVGASDASNWGEAGVVATIPVEFGEELLRHTLKKSIWVKLLSPARAWLRSHEMLSAEEEIPGEEAPYQSNPLWELCADGLQYRLVFAKAKKGPRHINVGELRAALKLERILAQKTPGSRHVIGLDSQVALGCLIKGRSSSAALNRELSKSIPHMVAFDSQLECLYYNTKINRADDPTRGREIRPASREWPDWFQSVCVGNFDAFDQWLTEHGIDDYSVSGLPPLDELGPRTLENNRSFQSVPPGKNAENSKVEFDKCSRASATDSDTYASNRDIPITQVDKNSCASPARVDHPADRSVPDSPNRLSDKALSILGSFPRHQFILPSGTPYPPDCPGFLDLFSGQRGVAKALAKVGFWSICFDIEHSPSEDLMDPFVQGQLKTLVEEGAFRGAGGGPVCTSFSTAITPPVRTPSEPHGRADVSANMAQKLADGNLMAKWVIHFFSLALKHKLIVWIENPATSWLFRLPEWVAFAQCHPTLQAWTVDYCRFKTKWRKRTKFMTNCSLAGTKMLCNGCKQHQLLRGRSKQHKQSWTRVAQSYPKELREYLSKHLTASVAASARTKLSIATCAKCTHGRIGEAGNPGPRPSHRARETTLEEVNLVEPRTLALQSRVWEGFHNWLSHLISPGALESAMANPSLLVLVLQQYGQHLFSSGKSLYIYRHLLVYIQQQFFGTRPFMGPCWQLVTKWEIQEPPRHRVPLPFPVLKAMLTTCLLWKWYRFAAILGLSFFGIARPGEPLREFRRNLLLPSDLLMDEQKVCYLKIEHPKTGRRGGGRVQHLTVSDPQFIRFLEKVFAVDQRQSSHEARLYECSASSFRRRWDAILRSLGISAQTQLTPGGLRGGGCVHAFQQGISLPLLLWKMRIRHMQTLENYLQETVADSVIPSFSAATRQRVIAASSIYELVLEAFLQR